MYGVAGDTLVYTATGVWRADDIWVTRAAPPVLCEAAEGAEAFLPSAGVVRCGRCAVARVGTREGYAVRATLDQGLFSEERGWVRLADLRPGEPVRVMRRGGAFGPAGGPAEGHVLGWLLASGHLTRDRAVLRFEGGARDGIALLLAAEVNAVIRPGRSRPQVAVGLVEARGGGAVTVSSSRLREFAVHAGVDGASCPVPSSVWRGARALQHAFLQALFEARASVSSVGPRAGVHLVASCYPQLLLDVQRLLLNFGLYSRVTAHRAATDGDGLSGEARDRHARAPARARPGVARVAPEPLAAVPVPRGGGARRTSERASHRLTLTGGSARRFPDAVGFLGEGKQRELREFAHSFSRRPYRERFVAHVETVQRDGAAWVYGVRAPGGFVANGLLAAAPSGAGAHEGPAGLRAGG